MLELKNYTNILTAYVKKVYTFPVLRDRLETLHHRCGEYQMKKSLLFHSRPFKRFLHFGVLMVELATLSLAAIVDDRTRAHLTRHFLINNQTMMTHTKPNRFNNRVKLSSLENTDHQHIKLNTICMRTGACLF